MCMVWSWAQVSSSVEFHVFYSWHTVLNWICGFVTPVISFIPSLMGIHSRSITTHLNCCWRKRNKLMLIVNFLVVLHVILKAFIRTWFIGGLFPHLPQCFCEKNINMIETFSKTFKVHYCIYCICIHTVYLLIPYVLANRIVFNRVKSHYCFRLMSWITFSLIWNFCFFFLQANTQWFLSLVHTYSKTHIFKLLAQHAFTGQLNTLLTHSEGNTIIWTHMEECFNCPFAHTWWPLLVGVSNWHGIIMPFWFLASF